MKIVVDAYGGDHAPGEIVRGCISALEERADFSIILTGKEDAIRELIKDCKVLDRIEIVNATDVITNDDSPAMAIKTRKDSSLVRAFDCLMSSDEVGALVSSGSTGAVLSGGILKDGRVRGIHRPTLLSCLPTLKDDKVVALADSGANVDCKPEFLLHFAIMASIYMQNVYGIEKPVIALLSNGAEDSKGNSLNKEAFKLLQASELNFYGNVEARDILKGEVDIVVADGFDGNIALKSSEGAALLVLEKLKQGIMQGGILAKVGYLFLKPVFKKLKKSLDYSEHGGAVFLGVNKPIVKGHGSSKAKSVKNTVLQAVSVVENRVAEKVKEALEIKREDS